MSKSDGEGPLPGVVSPRRPAWRVKFRAIMEEARAELKAEREAEEKALERSKI